MVVLTSYLPGSFRAVVVVHALAHGALCPPIVTVSLSRTPTVQAVIGGIVL